MSAPPPPDGDRGSGAALRRRERRLRALQRHVRTAVKLALAEKLHHSANKVAGPQRCDRTVRGTSLGASSYLLPPSLSFLLLLPPPLHHHPPPTTSSLLSLHPLPPTTFTPPHLPLLEGRTFGSFGPCWGHFKSKFSCLIVFVQFSMFCVFFDFFEPFQK